MTLIQFRDAIVARIDALMPELKTCEGYAGEFTEEELLRVTKAAPGIMVSIMGLREPEPQSGGTVDWTVRVVAVVYARSRRTLKRDVAALNLAEALVTHAYREDWGLDFVHPAGPATAQNLYAPRADMRGVAFWSVQWDQKVRLTVCPPADTEPVPPELYVGIAPDTGPEHIDEYELVGGADG